MQPYVSTECGYLPVSMQLMIRWHNSFIYADHQQMNTDQTSRVVLAPGPRPSRYLCAVEAEPLWMLSGCDLKVSASGASEVGECSFYTRDKHV